ncbi:MAG: PorT family protein [Tannerellaceae bacterium]|nr:PorT family protein [Tannerellaceae bacterium]
MKTILLIAAAMLGSTVAAMPADTTIVVNNKRIEIAEDGDRMKIKVYETNEVNEETESEQVFEGHYRNGNSHEKRINFNWGYKLPPSWSNKSFNPHWAGFGMGFINFSDNKLSQINNIDGISLRSESSLEYNLNVLETAFKLSPESNWAVVAGAGIRWSRYRLDGDRYLAESDDFTSLHPAPPGTVIKSSKLNITSLTIPLLLEWQNRRKGSTPAFFSAGVVGVIKTISSSRITYKDIFGDTQDGKMDRGMNLRPVTFDIIVQAGVGWIGAYARYSPLELFETGKGPKIYPVSLGLQIHL